MTTSSPSPPPIRVHLCLVEPHGYLHSGALADPLVFFQDQFSRCGAVVSAAKNELVAGATNFVFGSHLGVDPGELAHHDVVLVNLEQLGVGGAALPQAYTSLLQQLPTVDYHPDNASVYALSSTKSTIVRLGHAQYLDQGAPPLAERDIDLLFLGSLTPRRLDVLRRVEACGQRVSVPNGPVYGPERDALVRRARAVINVSAYESNRFEQVRASVVLSCGTPVISERRPWTSSTDERFLPYVHWFDAEQPADFFCESFRSAEFLERSRVMLRAWRTEDVLSDYERVLRSSASRTGAATTSASTSPQTADPLPVPDGLVAAAGPRAH